MTTTGASVRKMSPARSRHKSRRSLRRITKSACIVRRPSVAQGMSRELQEDILQAGPVQVEIDDTGASRGSAIENARSQGHIVEADVDHLTVLEGTWWPLQNRRAAHLVEPARPQRCVRAQVEAKPAAGSFDQLGRCSRSDNAAAV